MKMTNSLCVFLFLSFLGQNSFAASQVANTAPASSTAVVSSSSVTPYVVNVDSPSFRQLVVALPPIVAVQAAPATGVEQLAQMVEKDLKYFLEFTAVFATANPEAYAGIDLSKRDALPSDLVALNKLQQVGIESIVLGSVTSRGKISVLELRAADSINKKLMVAKAYDIARPDQIHEAVKSFVDHMLEAYTGRPGIFNTEIVFVCRKTKTSHKQICISDVTGEHVQQITSTNAIHLSPSWSPDRSKIVYTSFEDGNPDLFMYDRRTKTHQKLSGYKGVNSGGRFTPQGNMLVYSSTNLSNKAVTDIYMLDPLSKARVPFLTGQGIAVDADFSPDGKWLAFVSGLYGNPHIFRVELSWGAGGKTVSALNSKRLTFAGWYNATPAWSPDSKKLAFAGYDKEVDRFDLFMMDGDGSNLERLTLKRGNNESPTWAPNGQLIMFHSNRVGETDQKGTDQLYIMTKDGRGQRMVVTGMYEAQAPKWSR